MPEHTIAENLQRLIDAKTAIGSAITAKGGTVGANDGLEEFVADIATIPSGGGGGSKSNAVNFYDYDGTIVQSYSAADFANLSELPANPSHEGLTAQGWNWSLVKAKTYVNKYGKLDIGQMYVTDDGKTRIYITLTEGRISPILQLYLNANSELDIDWGDGSTHSTFTSTSAGYKSERHNYATAGEYVIAITVTTGNFVLQSSSTTVSSILWNGNNIASSPDRAYNNSIQKIEIGNGVAVISTSAFSNCSALSSITIPDSVTSISGYAFSNCSALQSITIPVSVTSVGNYAFYNCYSLSSITIPDSVTSISDYAFQYCSALSSITIPDSVTSISTSTFSNCYSLSSITIPVSVTSVGNYAFQYCSALSSITIPDSVTSIQTNVFNNCSALSSITIPDSVTSISDYAFQYCSALSSITIPDSVTSIDEHAFQNCYSLASITIDKIENSIYGYPWGATIGSPTYTSIMWTKSARFKYNCTETTGTTLTGTVDATVGDLIVATFVIRGNTYTFSGDWTLLGISEVVGNLNQRTAMAYKIAESTSESLTITQDTNGRIYINLVSITGASIGTFSGFTTQPLGKSITLDKPQGLVIWGVSSSLWETTAPYDLWGQSDYENVFGIQLPNTTQPRCLTALDQSDNQSETFTYAPSVEGDGALAAGSLTIAGIPNFWY